MSDDPGFDLQQQDEDLAGLAQGLILHAPAGWTQLDFTMHATATVSSSLLEATKTDGSIQNVKISARTKMQALQLRADMYEDGIGTWFTAKIKIRSDGTFESDFDYDSMPDFTPSLPPSAYAEDFEEYPRNPDHTPDWLSEQLAQDENEQ